MIETGRQSSSKVACFGLSSTNFAFIVIHLNIRDACAKLVLDL